MSVALVTVEIYSKWFQELQKYRTILHLSTLPLTNISQRGGVHNTPSLTTFTPSPLLPTTPTFQHNKNRWLPRLGSNVTEYVLILW